MRNLFTLKINDSFRVEKEGEVYSIFSHKMNKHTFIDYNGKVIDYSRPPLQDDEEPIEINDPDFIEEIGEGFYVYTTHEVIYDVDGKIGRFGIKYLNGEKLTEEIYYQVGKFCNGLCSVSEKDSYWGCINTKGELVIPYHFGEELFFNEYGVAVGNHSLIDRLGKEIPEPTVKKLIQRISRTIPNKNKTRTPASSVTKVTERIRTISAIGNTELRDSLIDEKISIMRTLQGNFTFYNNS